MAGRIAKRNSGIVIKNVSNHPVVEYDIPEDQGIIPPHQQVEFHTKGAEYNIKITVKDSQGKPIKSAEFHSECDDEWVVHDDKVVLAEVGRGSEPHRPRHRKHLVGETYKFEDVKL